MALTSSKVEGSLANLGGLKVQTFSLTFTSVTSGTLTTADHGFTDVVAALYMPTKTDDHGTIHPNASDTSNTFALGSVHIAGVTSGDTGKLTIIGR